MADDKAKKKIDLKARLGKTQMGMGAPAAVPLPVPGSQPGQTPPPPPDSGPGAQSDPGAPPAAVATPVPVAAPSRPAGIAPPPGISPGIPLPPFGPPRAAPKPEPKQTAQAQTIKVDVGEEIELERKKSRTRILLGALAGAVIGLGIGFVAGGSNEKKEVRVAGTKGAGELAALIKPANEKMTELSQKLADASSKLENKTFPDDLAQALSGINVPFDATRLEKKGVGGMPNRIQSALLKYTSGVEDVNKTKDSLRNILGLVQGPITAAWADEKEPKGKYSILFRADGSKGIVGDLASNKEPFPWANFPASLTVIKLENGKPAEKKATRWVKGDLTGSDPIVVPIDPKGMVGIAGIQTTADASLIQLRKAIYNLRQDLDGNKENPSQETPGLIKMGDDLANDLHKHSLTH